MEGAIRIRPAMVHDAYALWVWANDAATRAASHARQPIAWSAHVTWMTEQLACPHAVILMAEVGTGQPIGSTRFDTGDAWRTARLSYVMAPEARGHHMSRPMLVQATDWLRTEKRPNTIVADVMADNERSLRVFRSLGWRDVTGQPGEHRFERSFVSDRRA